MFFLAPFQAQAIETILLDILNPPLRVGKNKVL